MGVTVTSRPEVDRLVALPHLRRRLSIDTTANDSALFDIVEEVSRIAVREAGRSLVRSTFLETGPETSGKNVILANAPIEASSVAVTLSGEVLVAGTDFEVSDAAAGILWRSGTWLPSSGNPTELSVTYRAGYVPPTSMREWRPGANYAVGDWIAPNGARYVFECATAGESSAAGAEPDWAGAALAATVTDNEASWTARDAHAPPRSLDVAVIAAAHYIYRTRLLEAGTTRVEAEGHKRTFAPQMGEIPDQLCNAFRRLNLY